MNWFGGITLMFLGTAYLIYSTINRGKVTYYNRRGEMTIIKENEFLKLQLKFSIINSIFLILYGVPVAIFNLNNFFVIAGALVFHYINFLLKVESKKRGYIDYR